MKLEESSAVYVMGTNRLNAQGGAREARIRSKS